MLQNPGIREDRVVTSPSFQGSGRTEVSDLNVSWTSETAVKNNTEATRKGIPGAVSKNFKEVENNPTNIKEVPKERIWIFKENVSVSDGSPKIKVVVIVPWGSTKNPNIINTEREKVRETSRVDINRKQKNRITTSLNRDLFINTAPIHPEEVLIIHRVSRRINSRNFALDGDIFSDICNSTVPLPGNTSVVNSTGRETSKNSTMVVVRNLTVSSPGTFHTTL